MIDIKKSKALSVYFYGGEPTLFPEKIKSICSDLTYQLKDKSIDLDFNMYTNGTLINSNVFQIIKDYKFNNLQITLDGPPNLHNPKRPMKNHKDSFDLIYNNICKILDTSTTHITLLMNFDNENYRAIDDFLDYFKKYKSNKKLEFVFNPLFITESNSNYCTAHSFKTDKESAQIWAELYKTTINKGYNCNPLRVFDSGPCSFLRASNLIFDTNGDIYKCIGFLGSSNLSVGNVNSNTSNSILDKIENQISTSAWNNPECLSCSYLPLCIGGCRFHSLVSNNNIKEHYCHKELIEHCEINLIDFIHSKTTKS